MARESATAEMQQAPPKNVLITGASSGIGHACALRMDRAGWQVFATVRKESDARQLQNDASERVRTILLDVTDADQVEEDGANAVGEDGG